VCSSDLFLQVMRYRVIVIDLHITFFFDYTQLSFGRISFSTLFKLGKIMILSKVKYSYIAMNEKCKDIN
jgi:hypothetical protein